MLQVGTFLHKLGTPPPNLVSFWGVAKWGLIMHSPPSGYSKVGSPHDGELYGGKMGLLTSSKWGQRSPFGGTLTYIARRWNTDYSTCPLYVQA